MNPSTNASAAGMAQVPLNVAPMTRGYRQQTVKRPSDHRLRHTQLVSEHAQHDSLRAWRLRGGSGGEWEERCLSRTCLADQNPGGAAAGSGTHRIFSFRVLSRVCRWL